jgi:hypothetical protein
VNVSFINLGKTPAIKQWRKLKLVRYVHLTDDDAVRFFREQFADFDQAFQQDAASKYWPLIGRDIAPGQEDFSTAVLEKPTGLSPDELTALATGKLQLLLIGTIRYTDAFGGANQTDICSQFGGTDSRVWEYCNTRNTIR